MSLLSLLLSLLLVPQSTPEAPTRAGGPYHVYERTDTTRTPPPDGYSPFYISHFGRHGSRCLTGRHFSAARDGLREAALTPQGEALRDAVEAIHAAQPGAGRLTAVGARQQWEIGQRMARAYPEVFVPGRTIRASASAKSRCKESMGAFLQGLQDGGAASPARTRNSWHLYLRYSCILGKKQPESKACKQWTDALVERIPTCRFTREYFQEPPRQPGKLMQEVFLHGVEAQNLGLDTPLLSFFSEEEIQALSQYENARAYAENFGSTSFGILREKGAGKIIWGLMEDADQAIREGDIAAHLRFGHDSGLGPVVTLLGLVEAFPAEEAAGKFQSWKDICMASNLQLVFYRNQTGSILVKILYNEAERTLPGLPGGPYYPWETLRQYLASIGH